MAFKVARARTALQNKPIKSVVIATPTVAQNISDILSEYVFQDRISQSIQRDGQRLLDAINKNDINTIKRINLKYQVEAGKGTSGGAGPKQIKQPRQGAKDVWFVSYKALESLQSTGGNMRNPFKNVKTGKGTSKELIVFPHGAADVDSYTFWEEGVLVNGKTGRVTNRWGDGTKGVPEEVRELANEESTAFMPYTMEEYEWSHKNPRGISRTASERRIRHLARYGSVVLPPRGSGLRNPLEKFHAIMLTNGNTVRTAKKQFFCWSETGKRMELWSGRTGLLIKSWLRKSILWYG